MWEADFVLTIAERTGWAESFIRWRMPLSRGWAYWHAAVLRDGIRVRWPKAVDDWWGKARRLFAAERV